jgi:ribosome maturation factor RimP
MPPAQAGRPAATSSAAERLRAVLVPVVERTGYDLDVVTVTGVGRRRVVRLVVDGDEALDLDAIAEVSRAVSDELDAHDDALAGGPYVLEVTSPGVDRPLREHRHWRRAAGRLVRVDVAGAAFLGRVVSADDAGVTFADPADGSSRVIGWDSLGVGRIEIEFTRAGSSESEPDDDVDGEV